MSYRIVTRAVCKALPSEPDVLEMEDDGEDALVNRFYVAHAVATDRPEEYCG